MYKIKLKKYRMEKKLKLEELSELTGVSVGYLSHLENGTRNNPSVEIMDKISFALEKSITEIFFSK